MTKEGYSREKGEFQISFTNQYKVRKRIKEGDEIKRKNQWWWITEIEYGLSDRLETEIPFEHIHKRTIEDGSTTNLSETGIGDVGTGISLRLTGEERDKWWSHTISTGFVLLWSTGRWRKELGTDQFCWETNLAISKTFDNIDITLRDAITSCAIEMALRIIFFSIINGHVILQAASG